MKTPMEFRFPTIDTVLNYGLLCAALTLVAYVAFGQTILEVLI